MKLAGSGREIEAEKLLMGVDRHDKLRVPTKGWLGARIIRYSEVIPTDPDYGAFAEFLRNSRRIFPA